MKFEFAKYTDITDYAKKVVPEYNEYERVFICPDVWDFWICRILKGFNEDYEESPESFLVERNKIPMKSKGERISSTYKLKLILEEDDFGNWDCKEADSLEKCIEIVDGGYGIN